MRIPKTWIRPLAEHIINELTANGLIEPAVAKDKLLAETEAIILEELSLEDRVNEEVRQLLKKYEGEIEKGRLDYRKMFDLTKQKLIKERNLVL